MRTLDKVDVKDKKVLCRFDYDVPIDAGVITDTNRINASLPTLKLLLQNSAREVVILAHLGRPAGVNKTLSLKPVAFYLARELRSDHDPQETDIGNLVGFRISDKVTLIENVRFLKGEQENSLELAKQFASLGDIFVFDAFATAHREQSSTSGVANLLPSYAGLQVSAEIKNLSELRSSPNKPFVMIIGGAKIEDKLPVIQNLADLADMFLIGGAVGNTFLKAKGVDVRQSLVQEEQLETARTILDQMGDKLVLPTDHQWQDGQILDIGQRTILEFEDKLTDSETVFWNGNLGKTEERQFCRGSLLIADFLARSPEKTRIVAGGDTVGFLNQHNLIDKFTFASTGGGATLEYLAGNKLPGLQALEE